MPEQDTYRGADFPKLKRVQRFVPGFRGYSGESEFRDADRMVRMQLAQWLTVSKRNLEEAMGLMAERGMSSEGIRLESALNSLSRLSSEIGYDDSGYSWLAADRGPGGEGIDLLYEYDANLLDQMTILQGETSEFKQSVMASDLAAVERVLNFVQSRLSSIEDLLRRRMAVLDDQY